MGRIENLTSIDPGTGENIGVSRFKLRVLISCSLVGVGWHYRRDPGLGEEHVALEVPRVYRGFTKRPNDIVDLALEAGELWYECPREYRVKRFPADWKAQVDPDIMIERIKAHLTAKELQMAEASIEAYGAKGHNVWDSIGLGLVVLGRMGKGGR